MAYPFDPTASYEVDVSRWYSAKHRHDLVGHNARHRWLMTGGGSVPQILDTSTSVRGLLVHDVVALSDRIGDAVRPFDQTVVDICGELQLAVGEDRVRLTKALDFQSGLLRMWSPALRQCLAPEEKLLRAVDCARSSVHLVAYDAKKADDATVGRLFHETSSTLLDLLGPVSCASQVAA